MENILQQLDLLEFADASQSVNLCINISGARKYIVELLSLCQYDEKVLHCQISFNVGCGEINIKGTKENVREALGTFYQGIERVEGLIFPLSTQDVDILKNDETKEHFMSFLKDASINAVFTIDDNCIIIYAFEEHCIQLALQILQDNGIALSELNTIDTASGGVSDENMDADVNSGNNRAAQGYGLDACSKRILQDCGRRSANSHVPFDYLSLSENILEEVRRAAAESDRTCDRNQNRDSGNMKLTFGKRTILLEEGDISKKHADVLVNAVNENLDMAAALPSAFHRAGGEELKEACKHFSSANCKPGNVMETVPGSLHCKTVYHTVCSYYKKDQNLKTLKHILKECLKKGSRSGHKSIALPCIGCGNLHYPPKSVASLFIDTIDEYFSETESTSIQEVCIVVFESTVYEDFRQEFESRTGAVGGEYLPSKRSPDISMPNRNQETPPNYWKKHKERPWEEVLRSFCPRMSTILTDVQRTTFEAVKHIVEKSWQQKHTCAGKDAVGLSHASIRVTKVTRIEHPVLYENYNNRRKLFSTGKKRGIGKGEEPVLTTTLGLDYFDEKRQKNINEVFLFHGTTDAVEAIVQQGFDSRVSSKGLFGDGVYFAESSTKADQYADAKWNRGERETLTMILARVLLGNVYVCEKGTAFRRPPCMTDGCMQAGCTKHLQLFDSVMGVSHGGAQQLGFLGWIFSSVAPRRLLFREFVIFENSQIYPEFLIHYTRE